jgi:20S proteasome subunit beta 3
MDLLGAPVVTDTFAVSGTCTSNLRGMCEAMYRPDLVCSWRSVSYSPLNVTLIYCLHLSQGPEELFEVVSQCLLAAVDRDAISGWGAEVHIVTPEGTLTRTLKCRQD